MNNYYTRKKDKYYDHLLEQYKIYLELADKVSERRINANKFYILLLSTLFTVYSFFISLVVNKENPSSNFICNLVNDRELTLFILISIAIIGIVFSVLWVITIHSYKQLNTGKFAVILEMEKELPCECFYAEWIRLGEGVDKKKYFQFTKVEKFVPFVFICIFLTIIIIITVKL